MEFITPLSFAVFLLMICVNHAVIQVTPSDSHLFIKKSGSMKLTCVSNTQNIDLAWETPHGFTDDYGVQTKNVDFNNEQPSGGIKRFKTELTFTNHQVGGKYNCVAKNKSTDKVLEEYPVQVYTVVEEVKEAEFFRDIPDVNISCKITVENTDTEIDETPEWKKNDTLVEKIITDGSEISAEKDTLTFIDVMRSDAALYTAEYSIKLKDPNVKTTFSYACNVPLNAGPLVKDFEKSKNLIQEDNLELQCNVLGYPVPAIKWLKDNEDLDDSGTRITRNELHGVKNATLKIKNVVFEDAGEYTCVADSGAMGNNSKTITVRVKDKYAALWPFLGIVCEVIVLCTIIFIYEKRRSRQAEQEDAAHDEPEPVQKGNVRNRRNQK